MKRTSLLILFFICLPVYGQDLPNLEFKNTTFTYGAGNSTIEAFSNNSEGKITYKVIAWKSDKDDSEQGEHPVVDQWYGPWYVENAGWAEVRATIAAWENFSEHSITAKITVGKKPVSVRVNNAERIYGDSSESYDFVEINPGDILKRDFPLNPAPKYTHIEKEADVNDGIDSKQYPITFSSDPKWNYDISVEPGYLTIKKADLLIAHKYPDGASYYMDEGEKIFYYEKVYGDENPEFIAGWEPVEGLKEWDIGKDIVTGNLQIDAGDVDRTTDCGTESLSLDASGMVSDNYNVKLAVDAEAILIIKPKTLTLKAEDATVEYGELKEANENKKFQFNSEEDWIKKEDKNSFDSVPIIQISVEEIEDDIDLDTLSVGVYTGAIKFVSAGVHKNYILNTTKDGDLSVEQAPLKIFPNSYSTKYKNPKDSVDVIIIEKLKNDRDIERFRDVYSFERISGNLYRNNGNNYLEYNIDDTVGTYTISIDQSKLVINEKNYDVTIEDGSYIINRAELTINIEDINVFVGDTMPELKPPGLVVDHHPVPYDPAELYYYLSSECLSMDYFSSISPNTININCNTIDLANYTVQVDTGKLTVYAVSIDDQDDILSVCRDASGRMGIKSESPGRSYEWYIKFPEADSFQVINQTIIDTLKLSGLATDSLQLDSALISYEEYLFKCKLTSTIKVYPDRDSLERANWTESGPIGIEILETPPFTRVILKGESILISGDPYAYSYKWYKSGEETVLDSMQYLDIYGDESNKDQYYVITSNMNGCSTKSSRLTEDGDNGKARYYPDSLVISISPNPVRQGEILRILATDLDDGKSFDIFIYNQMGELKLHKSGTVVRQNLVSLKLDELKIEPGIYYLNLTHNSMRSSKVLLVSD